MALFSFVLSHELSSGSHSRGVVSLAPRAGSVLSVQALAIAGSVSSSTIRHSLISCEVVVVLVKRRLHCSTPQKLPRQHFFSGKTLRLQATAHLAVFRVSENRLPPYHW